MLTALSLAEKLGSRGLHAFSLHPGIIWTNLANHVDWEAGELRESPTAHTRRWYCVVTTGANS